MVRPLPFSIRKYVVLFMSICEPPGPMDLTRVKPHRHVGNKPVEFQPMTHNVFNSMTFLSDVAPTLTGREPRWPEVILVAHRSSPGEVMLPRLHTRPEKGGIGLGRRPPPPITTPTYRTRSQRRVVMPQIYTSRAGDTRSLRSESVRMHPLLTKSNQKK
jgi:hypothetical protein